MKLRRLKIGPDGMAEVTLLTDPIPRHVSLVNWGANDAPAVSWKSAVIDAESAGTAQVVLRSPPSGKAVDPNTSDEVSLRGFVDQTVEAWGACVMAILATPLSRSDRAAQIRAITVQAGARIAAAMKLLGQTSKKIASSHRSAALVLPSVPVAPTLDGEIHRKIMETAVAATLPYLVDISMEMAKSGGTTEDILSRFSEVADAFAKAAADHPAGVVGVSLKAGEIAGVYAGEFILDDTLFQASAGKDEYRWVVSREIPAMKYGETTDIASWLVPPDDEFGSPAKVAETKKISYSSTIIDADYETVSSKQPFSDKAKGKFYRHGSSVAAGMDSAAGWALEHPALTVLALRTAIAVGAHGYKRWKAYRAAKKGDGVVKAKGSRMPGWPAINFRRGKGKPAATTSEKAAAGTEVNSLVASMTDINGYEIRLMADFGHKASFETKDHSSETMEAVCLRANVIDDDGLVAWSTGEIYFPSKDDPDLLVPVEIQLRAYSGILLTEAALYTDFISSKVGEKTPTERSMPLTLQMLQALADEDPVGFLNVIRSAIVSAKKTKGVDIAQKFFWGDTGVEQHDPGQILASLIGFQNGEALQQAIATAVGGIDVSKAAGAGLTVASTFKAGLAKFINSEITTNPGGDLAMSIKSLVAPDVAKAVVESLRQVIDGGHIGTPRSGVNFDAPDGDVNLTPDLPSALRS